MHKELEIHVSSGAGWTTLQGKCEFVSGIKTKKSQFASSETVPFATVTAETPVAGGLESASFVLGSNCSFRALLSLARFPLAH